MQLQLEVKPAHVVVPKGRGGAGPISSCDMIDRSDGTASRFPVSLLSWSIRRFHPPLEFEI